MSNGYYTSPTANYPAPRNIGGYNAQQLSLQKNIQENVRKFNTKIREARVFQNAPLFSDHVKDFWSTKITEYSDAQNNYVAGDISATESTKSQDDINALWKSWTTVAPYVAALGEEVNRYGIAGELDKLNDPNLEALLMHMQKNDGSVTLQNNGNKLYLTGKGEIDEKNTNGESTGNKLPWEYDLDIDAFLQIIGVNAYGSKDGVPLADNNEAVYNNLNKIIRRRATEDTMDFQSTIDATITQSSQAWEVEVFDRNNKKTGTRELEFIYEDLLRDNLNYGGGSGLGQLERGSTKWVGTEDSPALMNSPDFASYYANVLYKDYQPHYNEESEIDWLIRYDENGNIEKQVKPWNLADEDIWVPTRDILTQRAIESDGAVNQALMVRLKDGADGESENYKEILDKEYGGNINAFYENYNGEDGISADPFKYYEGINGNANKKWREAADYFYAGRKAVDSTDSTDSTVIQGDVSTEADCDPETQIFNAAIGQCVPKARYTITKIFSDWGTLGDNPRDLTINTRVSPEDMINDLNTAPYLVDGTPMTSAEVFASIKGVDGKPLRLSISESSDGEMKLFVKNPQGNKWENNKWKEGSMRGKGKGMVKEVNINLSTDKSIEDLMEKILTELKKVGAQNL